MTSFDYESIWMDVWGDMQRFGPTHRHHRRIFSQLLSRIPREEIATVADIGCGEGSNLLYLATEFPRAQLFGFDISQAALERARTRVQATFATLDIQSEAPGGSFDLVICADVIEHIEDDCRTFVHIHQSTGKYALFSSVQGQMREFERSIGHVRSYAHGELKKKLESAGFRILQIVEWGFPFYSPFYRNLFDKPAYEAASHGQYGFSKKLACKVLYSAFFLNSMHRGDVIFALVAKE
jgi:SAM-dependent methyltransferase